MLLLSLEWFFPLNKMKICECVNVLGQNSFDHVNAFFLAPIICNLSWCTTRVATNIIKIYKVTHKTTGVYLFINKSILLLLLLFSIFVVLKVWWFFLKIAFWVKFTLKNEIPQGMCSESHFLCYKVTHQNTCTQILKECPQSPISTKLQNLTPHTHKTCIQILKKGMSLEYCDIVEAVIIHKMI